jgi:hypothetical protein
MTAWMIGSDGLAGIAKASEALAAKFFNTPDAYVIGHPPVIPHGWVCNPVVDYNSFAKYKADPKAAQYRWVLYDPEKWVNTPLDEQMHPHLIPGRPPKPGFLDQFATLAHKRGSKVIETPARDLCAVAGGDFHGSGGIDASYLSKRVAAACHLADVFECQAQADQHDLALFTKLVMGSKAQLQPWQPIWAGLTTLRKDSTAAQVRECYDAVVAEVDGFWLNTYGASVSIAAEFLAGLP